MKRKGANISLCKTPTITLKNSVSPLGDWTCEWVFLYGIMMANTVSFRILYTNMISSSFPWWMELKALEKSTNTSTTLRFLTFTIIPQLYGGWLEFGQLLICFVWNYFGFCIGSCPVQGRCDSIRAGCRFWRLLWWVLSLDSLLWEACQPGLQSVFSIC